MKKIGFKRTVALLVGVATILLLCFACTDDLDVKQAYYFDLVTMPVQKKIMEGETAEIRCTIFREGDYQETRYYIRYFQPDGYGELRLDDGTLLLPNDLYPLEKEVFRMYYTSRCTDQQTIDVYIQDSFGQVVQKTFSFQNNRGEDEDKEGE